MKTQHNDLAKIQLLAAFVTIRKPKVIEGSVSGEFLVKTQSPADAVRVIEELRRNNYKANLQSPYNSTLIVVNA